METSRTTAQYNRNDRYNVLYEIEWILSVLWIFFVRQTRQIRQIQRYGNQALGYGTPVMKWRFLKCFYDFERLIWNCGLLSHQVLLSWFDFMSSWSFCELQDFYWSCLARIKDLPFWTRGMNIQYKSAEKVTLTCTISSLGYFSLLAYSSKCL